MNLRSLSRLTLALLLAAAGGVAWAEIQIVEDAEPAPTATTTISVPSAATVMPTAGEGRKADELLFRNGDRLSGNLTRAVAGEAVVWKHPDVATPIEFTPANVVQVKLAGTSPPASLPAQTVVRLTNGDELRGQIVALTADQLVIETWYAGQVTLRRPMVAALLPNAGRSGALYVGPVNEDDWQNARQRQAWTFKDGAFYSTGSGAIGREMKLPDQVRIDFDLAWRNYAYLQLAMYTDNLEQVYGNCYMLQVSGNSVYLQRGRNRSFNNLGGGTNVENLQQKARAHFTVLVDKEKKTIALYIDDEMIKQWVDSGDFAGTGTGMVFQSQGQGPVKLSSIRVSEWDGQLPNQTEVAAVDEDVIRFINNDKVSGQLKTITKDAITFVTAFATLDIPLERATQIDLSSQSAERARRQANDIVAFFHDGGRVTLELAKIDGQSLAGSSENFGQLSFARNAFQELRFHIYDETITLGRGDDDW